MHDAPERHAELVLLGSELDAVLDVRQLLAEGVEPGEAARGAFHESVQVGAEEIEARIGEATEVARLER